LEERRICSSSHVKASCVIKKSFFLAPETKAAALLGNFSSRQKTPEDFPGN
jgi:hypothetical protein